MNQLPINIGRTANDKTGDTLRVAFNKVNLNFTELYAGAASGTVSYTAATATDWSGTPPATMQEAIDRLAAAFKTLHNGTGA